MKSSIPTRQLMQNNYKVEYSIDGYEILHVNKNNKWLYLGSKYNMKKEIDIIQKNIKNISSLKSIIVFGGANGVWIENIDMITTGKEVLIVEPDKELFEALIHKKYNVNKNIISVTNMDDDNFYENMVASVNKSNFEVLVFGNYDMVYKDEFKKFIDNVIWMFTDIQIGENTSKYFSKIWFNSFLNNIPYVLEAEIVDSYKDAFKNKPAIIVSAGPSLDKNLKYLKENEDKFIIISAGRTLNTLKRAGIKADFSCIIDASEAMYNVFKPSLDMDIPLLMNEETSEKIVKEYKGKKIFFNTKEFLNASGEIFGFNTEVLFQGGSVAHACTSFAKLLGCDPIAFIGQDLAYTHNKLHSDNSVAENESNTTASTEIYVKGVVEEKILTSQELNMFRERLELFIKLHRETTFINCTEGGANIEGTSIKKFKDFIEEFSEIIDKSIINEYKKANISKEKVINKLNEIYNEIDNIIDLCKEAKKINSSLVDLYIKSTGKYNKALNKLDIIDKEMNDKNNHLFIFEPLTQPINTSLSKKFGDTKEEYNSIIDKIKLVSEKGIYLNDEFIRVFDYGKPLIKKCIDNLEELL